MAYDCTACLDGRIVSATCDECDERHCQVCDPCDDCMCDWPAGCAGTGNLTCSGCGGDQCVCVCGGESECYGCELCDAADAEEFDDATEEGA